MQTPTLWRGATPLLALGVMAGAAQAQAPSIASFSPYQGAPGTVVSVSGNNLKTTSAFYFNGTPATAIQVTSDWGIKVTIPSGATTGKLKVVTSFGTYTTSSNFSITSGSGGGGGGGATGSPSIATFNPYHGVAGAVVTISGSNLATTSAVSINGTPCTQLQVVNDYSVKVTIAPGTATGKVKITTAYGSYTTSSDFIIDGSSGSGSDPNGGGDPVGFINPPAIDPPAGTMVGHPRLFIRSNDLSRLRSWATPSNPVWVSLEQLAISLKQAMDTGQIVDSGYGGGNASSCTESYAELFALMAQVHPDPATRSDYGSRAYTLIMTVFNEAAKGQADGQPFRGKEFAIDNRASWYGEAFPLVVDWIYDRFTPADKAKIRAVFLRWTQECLRATTTGQDHPSPVGVVNDPALTTTKRQVAWSANNYYLNHMRQIGMMSMALDAADDIPAMATDPAAGTLRRFVGNAIGAWLYQVKANESAYSAGGIAPEGIGYGELSQRATAFLLLAMHTTGTDNPAVYGAPAATLASPYWTQGIIESYNHLLSPATVVQENWIGPSYLPYAFGDNSFYRNSDFVRVFGSLAIAALNSGDTARYNRLRWMIDNLPPGGVGARHYKMTTAMSGSSVSLPILYFLASDPSYSPIPDPRPSLPTTYFAPGQGVLLSRTSWDPSAAWFTFKLSSIGIDHQFADGNAIGFWRGGEWLTKPAAGYGDNIGSSDSQNTLSIQNSGTPNLSFWQTNQAHGSQWFYNPDAEPSRTTSTGPGYTYADGDATNLYNLPSIGATDVAHASRSVLWLQPDTIVVYDRATSKSVGKAKRFNLNTATLASVSGRSALVTMASGQKLFIDTVLPATAVLSAGTMPGIGNEKAFYEPMQYRLMAEDPSNPLDVRFLSVLQGANPQAAKQAVTGLTSSNGTAFDGVLVGSTAVWFKRDVTAAFTSVTITVPVGTTVYLTGLTPSAGYTVVSQPNGNLVQLTITPGGALATDSAGVLRVG